MKYALLSTSSLLALSKYHLNIHLIRQLFIYTDRSLDFPPTFPFLYPSILHIASIIYNRFFIILCYCRYTNSYVSSFPQFAIEILARNSHFNDTIHEIAVLFSTISTEPK